MVCTPHELKQRAVLAHERYMYAGMELDNAREALAVALMEALRSDVSGREIAEATGLSQPAVSRMAKRARGRV